MERKKVPLREDSEKTWARCVWVWGLQCYACVDRTLGILCGERGGHGWWCMRSSDAGLAGAREHHTFPIQGGKALSPWIQAWMLSVLPREEICSWWVLVPSRRGDTKERVKNVAWRHGCETHSCPWLKWNHMSRGPSTPEYLIRNRPFSHSQCVCIGCKPDIANRGTRGKMLSQEKIVHPDSGILFSNKKEWSTEEYHNPSDPWKERHMKPVTRVPIVWFHSYEMFGIGKPIKTWRLVVASGWQGRGEMRNDY